MSARLTEILGKNVSQRLRIFQNIYIHFTLKIFRIDNAVTVEYTCIDVFWRKILQENFQQSFAQMSLMKEDTLRAIHGNNYVDIGFL